MLLGLYACAGAKIGEDPGGTGSSSGGDGGAGGGGGSGVRINLDGSLPRPDAHKSDLPGDVKPFAVDDAGNAICLSILSLGQPAHYGDQSGGGDNTDAFQTFINTYTANANTGTTSVMTMVETHVTLTDDYLKQYNVLILQALEDSEYTGLWTFSQSETDALERWVRAGGALITMSGYGSNTTEVQPLNQLLGGQHQWSGISYNTDDTFNSCPDNMCYCAYSAVSFDGWTSDYADYDQITHDLRKVGVFHGRSVNCTGSDCQIFAKDPTYGNVGVAKDVGSGHVLAWGDEWVTYTSQWGLTDGQYDNASNPQCAGYTPKTSFSVPQFWYNVLTWSAPTMDWCFTISVPPTADPGQQVIY